MTDKDQAKTIKREAKKKIIARLEKRMEAYDGFLEDGYSAREAVEYEHKRDAIFEAIQIIKRVRL